MQIYPLPLCVRSLCTGLEFIGISQLSSVHLFFCLPDLHMASRVPLLKDMLLPFVKVRRRSPEGPQKGAWPPAFPTAGPTGSPRPPAVLQTPPHLPSALSGPQWALRLLHCLLRHGRPQDFFIPMMPVFLLLEDKASQTIVSPSPNPWSRSCFPCGQ